MMRFSEWLISETDLSYLLSPPGETPHIGPEKGHQVGDGIAKYTSPHGSVRYVFYSKGSPVGALQLVTTDGRKAKVANVFTHPEFRRQKIASMLLQQAKSDFRSVEHQPYDDLSDDAKAWVDSMS